MAASPQAPNPRLARRARLCGAIFAAVLVAASGAPAQSLYMRVDGVKGENPSGQPLGSDAFALKNFAVSTDQVANPKASGSAESAERFGDVSFTLPINGPAVALWQLAAQRQEIPKASLVALDKDTGATRFRVDLEQVVVRSLGFQTLGTREAASGALGYQRIRIRYGEGNDGPTASWDRVRNAPWK